MARANEESKGKAVADCPRGDCGCHRFDANDERFMAAAIVKCAGCDESVPVRPYDVTFTSGSIERVNYCDDCADLARMNWNGETAAIKGAAVGQSASEAVRS